VRALVALGLASKGEAVKSASDICHHRPIVRFVLLDSNACRGLTQKFTDAIVAGMSCGESSYRTLKSFQTTLDI